MLFLGVYRLAATAAFCLLAGPLAASETGWTLARNPHFEVYSQAGAEDARQVLLWFERLRAFFEQQTGVDVDSRLPPLRIVVFSSVEEYAPFRLHPTADAYYAASDLRDYIVLPGPNADRLGAHEYWHFVAHTGGLRLPPWLNEGLAEFFSTVRLEARGGRVGAAPPLHIGSLRHRFWIRLPALLSLAADSPLLGERETSQMFYAESWALAHMLKLSPAYAPRFPQLMERLASGMPSSQALETVYARPVDAIASDLRAWFLKGRFAPVPPAAPSDPVSIDLSEVSSFAVRSLLAEILSSAEKPDRAEALYRELAREAPEDPQVSAALAILALRKNDLTEARLQWRHALDHRIADAQACYHFAKLAEDAGLPVAEVRPALERAVVLEPGFDDALFSLALAENHAGQPQAALEHLRAMRTILPARRFVYWTAIADAANALGRREEAKAAAETAKTWAATADERAFAERLAYMAETDLAVRFSRDASGHPLLETTRAPHDASGWNPFIEPADRVRRVEARLREIACSTVSSPGPTVFVLETASAVLQLALPDPTHVQMRNAPPEFTCGPQSQAQVLAVYAETGPATGLLRGLEFR